MKDTLVVLFFGLSFEILINLIVLTILWPQWVSPCCLVINWTNCFWDSSRLYLRILWSSIHCFSCSLVFALTLKLTYFLTAILHRGLRNDFFFSFSNLLFPIFIWTFISLFYLDFYFPFLSGLLFPFSIWTFIRFKFVLNSF